MSVYRVVSHNEDREDPHEHLCTKRSLKAAMHFVEREIALVVKEVADSEHYKSFGISLRHMTERDGPKLTYYLFEWKGNKHPTLEDAKKLTCEQYTITTESVT